LFSAKELVMRPKQDDYAFALFIHKLFFKDKRLAD